MVGRAEECLTTLQSRKEHLVKRRGEWMETLTAELHAQSPRVMHCRHFQMEAGAQTNEVFLLNTCLTRVQGRSQAGLQDCKQ